MQLVFFEDFGDQEHVFSPVWNIFSCSTIISIFVIFAGAEVCACTDISIIRRYAKEIANRYVAISHVCLFSCKFTQILRPINEILLLVNLYVDQYAINKCLAILRINVSSEFNLVLLMCICLCGHEALDECVHKVWEKLPQKDGWVHGLPGKIHLTCPRPRSLPRDTCQICQYYEIEIIIKRL